MEKHKVFRVLDLLSASILAFLALFSIARFNDLPQFFDGYYHLSCANAFIKSGGWVGIDWWSAVPEKLPHLYPPAYHLIIVFLKSVGLSGINAIRLTESLAIPLFFLILWFVFRKNLGSLFSFFFVLIGSSFFSFFVSISGNVPATMALICGILSLHFLRGKRFLPAVCFLTLAFYTHPGIPWIFFISFLFLLILSKEHRIISMKLILGALFLSLPIIYHQIKNVKHVNFEFLGENSFIHFNIFVLVFGLFSIFLFIKNRDFFVLLFSGYCLGAAFVFLKYPFRFFSAQGMLGFILLVAYFLKFLVMKFRGIERIAIFLFIGLYLFLFSSTIDLNEKKYELNLFNSTYYNLASGNFIDNIHFASFFNSDEHGPAISRIQKLSDEFDVIVSDLSLPSRMFSALANRPTSFSALGEVKSLKSKDPYSVAKIIIGHKPYSSNFNRLLDKLKLSQVFENERVGLFINPIYQDSLVPVKAKISFKVIILILIFFSFLFIPDMLKFINQILCRLQP